MTHQTLSLTGLKSVPLERQHHWRPTTCTSLKLSTCGNWLAAGLAAVQVPDQKTLRPQQPVECEESTLHEVVVYRIPGFDLQTSLDCGTCRVRLQWASEDPHLSIALLPFPADPDPGSVAPQIPAACIMDAETGTVLSSLSTDTVEAALALTRCPHSDPNWSKEYQHKLVWSRCGKRLLFAQQTHEHPSFDRPCSTGVLQVYDVLEDRLMLESQYTCQETHLQAVWHPSSLGIVVGSGSSIHNLGAFAQAHMALGRLPAPLMMHEDPGFSADGQFYCAVAREVRYNHLWQLLRSSFQEHIISFTAVRKLTGAHCCWVVSGSLAIHYRAVDSRCLYRAQVTDLATCKTICHLDKLPTHTLRSMNGLSLSPSLQFVGDGSTANPRIVCASTGVQLWALDRGPGASPTEEGPPVYDCERSLVFWLPSGRSLVCLDRGDDNIWASIHMALFS